MLYDTGNFKLAEPKVLNNKELQEKAKEDYEQWFESANGFYEGFKFYLIEKVIIAIRFINTSS